MSNVKITATSHRMKANLPCITSQLDICPIPFHYDTYVGCNHGCLYCFARDNVNFRRRNSTLQFNDLEFNSVKNFHNKFNKFLINRTKVNDPVVEFIKNRVPLKIGANADPFPKMELENKITYHTLKILMNLDYPVQVQTKNPDVFLQYAKDFVGYDNFIISVSTSFSDDLSAKIEPNVIRTSERFAAIKKLTEMGFNVMAKCQPAIYPVVMDDLEFLVNSAHEAGCWAFGIEGLKLRFTASQKEKQFNIKLGKIIGIDDIYEYYKKKGERTTTDYELSLAMKLEYSKKARELCHKVGMKFLSADNQKECILLSDSDECCGTEKLKNYKKFSYNYRTKVKSGKEWSELENGLEKCIYKGRNYTEGIELKKLVDKKVKK